VDAKETEVENKWEDGREHGDSEEGRGSGEKDRTREFKGDCQASSTRSLKYDIHASASVSGVMHHGVMWSVPP
jgi:hypothetical protein